VRVVADRQEEGNHLKARVGIRGVNLCQHRGCPKEGFPCHSASGDEENNGFHCFKHCSEYRFCLSFGLPWEATGFFDFRNGLCVNGRKDLEAESGEKEEDFEDFDRRISDEISDCEESLKYYRGQLPQEASHCDPFPEKIILKCS
jgi:hypothetical protein